MFFKLSKEYFHKPTSYTTLESIMISYEKVKTIGEELTELLHDLRDTNNSLLSAKINETSTTFTLIAFLTMPATLFYSIISLPTKQKHMFIGYDNDFTIIMSISGLLFLIMFGITI